MKAIYLLFFMLSFNIITLAMKHPHASPPIEMKWGSRHRSQENHKGSDCGIAIEPTIKHLLRRGTIQSPYNQPEDIFIESMLAELEYEPGVNAGQWYGNADVLDYVIIDMAKFFEPIREESDILFGDMPEEIEVKSIIVSLFANGTLGVWPCYSQNDHIFDILGKLRRKPGISTDEKWHGTKTQLIDLILEVGACYKK